MRVPIDSLDHVELIGLGIGPGDPGLISLKAAAILEGVDLVLAPAARVKERSLAASIISGLGLRIKELVELEFPMERRPEIVGEAWTRAALPALAALAAGKRIAFITLGDSSLYSTWLYFRKAVLKGRPATRTATIPGITAASAAAALLERPLAEGAEGFALLPLPDPVEGLDPLLPLVERLVIYKIGPRLPELLRWVEERGLGAGASLASGIGLGERERSGPLVDLARAENGYLSLAIIDTGKSGAKLGVRWEQ